MSKFFRKVASAFVQLEPEPEPRPAASSDPAPSAPPRERTAGGLDSLTDDAASLLAQLEGSGGGASGSPGAEPAPETGVTSALGGPFDPLASVQMNADDVFRRAGVADGPSSAQKLLKILGGLAMFPREQQLTMIRAMDAADETWDEKSVVEDARLRQEALRTHMRRVTEERMAQAQALQAEMEGAKQAGAAVLAEIDKRIQELYQRREAEAKATAETISKLQVLDQQLRQQEDTARRGIAKVVDVLGGLIGFFEGSGPGAAPPSRPT